MMLTNLLALAALAKSSQAAQSSLVSGTAPGFASGVTGGGDAAPVYPTTVAELTEYLTSSSPQNIVIKDTFDFVGSEGTKTEKACNSYSCTPEENGQALLNTLDGCGSTATYDVTVDVAGMVGINVASDKTLIGQGSGAVLNGKGLRFVDVSNIIIQNIAITNLNPKYVWGGDAISFSDTSKIWIDHVTTSSLGRQHYSFGTGSDKAITISNSFMNGKTDYSATCDGHSYWGLELVGSDDQITFYSKLEYIRDQPDSANQWLTIPENHVSYTSGRTPALSGTTLFHAVNNVWADNSGHALEGTSKGKGLYEGNLFNNVPNIAGSDFVGQLFSSQEADVGKCAASLKRDCVTNEYTNSGTFNFSDTGFFSELESLSIVAAEPVSSIKDSVIADAGNTL
ncbi:unnamed protein product [Penicillium olsonii]|nr:unnamed protein product [Penicillium olsonii]CAG7923110.1 unnamed protein product [Penicillium olsonii]